MEKWDTFDVVSDESDHRFVLQNIGRNCFTDSKCQVYKTIMKEWKILQKNLPDSIYVRVYERRIDLLRAVIVGAAGTPYHDGLFFFDIAFPSNYPNNPPHIYYHSFGFGLNPNLYSHGLVCLSLLNTWIGKKCEKWNPSNSTLLQVLVSIQALVLNEKPLFNEPAYRLLTRSIFEGKSRAYNDSVFVLTCYSCLSIIRNPPANFEEFVRKHFRERGHVILAACIEYANGRVRVGYYGYNKIASSSSKVVKVSASFQGSLRSVYRAMYKQFEQCGASLESFFAELELEKKQNRRKDGSGIFKKAMGKIKQAFGWKKEKKST
ncbi:putative ubiquitin-conjugating enzyme E2 38 [Cicer arietinum]|uniref:Ubiquitin-conjugating enzyme E2 38 n=1 Tax=Cicer arietinum TaxID=3827 RepID=A0A1S3E9C1_CICAR|nr:putative ubiquitin-conjugating enzyme E2 38 [Cicer arietinum]